jgi:hypothetical protein
MTFGPMQVSVGMTVVDTAGAEIGRVSEVGAEEFVIQRADGKVTQTYKSVRALLGNQVVLDTGPDLDRHDA